MDYARKLGWSLVAALLAQACVQGAPPQSSDEAPPSAADAATEIGLLAQGASSEALPLQPIADTTIRATLPDRNDGAGSTLGVTSASIADLRRTIVKFDTALMDSRVPMDKVLHSARLDMKVVGISAGWLGGSVDAMRMTMPWTEGSSFFGTGATWNCANDINIGNWSPNCAGGDLWSQLSTGPNPRPFFTEATDRARIFTGGLSTVSFDVTADVQQFLNGTADNHGWMLVGAANPFGGEWVNFGSRTASNANRPQLFLYYGDDECPNNPDKGVPGVCGCDTPDRDTNLDGIVDCVDAAVTVTADATLKLAIPTGNDGTGVFLGATSASVVDLERALLRVDSNAISIAAAGKPIMKATLELTVAGIAFGWAGGTLDLNRMTRSWGEGTGLAGSPGGGATWTCSHDRNTTLFGNLMPNFIDCGGSDWGMQFFDIYPRPFTPAPSASSGIVWPGMRTVRFDVTDDIKDMILSPGANHGWILQGSASTWLSGSYVKFGSRESGAPPRILLELAPPCPPGITKTEPGECGCFIADVHSDGDGVADCIDECDFDATKTKRGVCGCNEADTDSDGDCIPDCIDPCPDDGDTAAGGQCGCPSNPKPVGTDCGDGLSGGIEQCDGAGHCGDALAYSPDPSCDCQLVRSPGKAYWFCPCAETRSGANTQCTSVEGQELVAIESDEENTLITGCLAGNAWTGANDLGAGEGDWRWNTESLGEDTTFWNGDAASGSAHQGKYENWSAGEPAADDCGAISAVPATEGQWYASSCGTALGYVCETGHVEIQPPPEFTDICMLAGIPCGPGEGGNPPDGGPIACVPEDEAFEDFYEMTEAEWKAAAAACEAAAAGCDPNAAACPAADAACSGPLEPPAPGVNTCTPLDPAINPAANGVVCPLALPPGFNTNTLQRCTDPDVATQCPVGQQCGFAQRCTACDPSAGPCPLCYGEQDCPGLDNRCETFLACGMPSCQYFCPNEQAAAAVPVDECRIDSDCGGGEQCGWMSRCSECDPAAGNCPPCNSAVNTPDGSTGDSCPGVDNRCVQFLGCGVAREGCFRLDVAESARCTETVVCGGPEAGPFDVDILQEPGLPDILTAADFGPAEEPDPATSKFEEQPPCPNPATCASAAQPNRQGFDHPYCRYEVPDDKQLESRDTDSAFDPTPDKKTEVDNSKINFTVEPSLDLTYDVKAGPLGLMYPKLSARAEFSAGVEVNDLLKVTDSFDVIALIGEINVGLRPGDNPADPVAGGVCGVDPGDTTIEIFEMDLLPAEFVDAIRIPDDDARKKCIETVADFEEAVGRAKKAFFDAQALLKEYRRRAELPTPQTFRGPTAMFPDRLSLCELLVKAPPPLGFPAAVGSGATPEEKCHNELPEDTINRFISFYNKQLELVSTQAVNEVADGLDGLLADAVGCSDCRDEYGDGLGFKIPLASLHDVEEINIVNQTFFVGPIPCLLQVMFIVEYGMNIDAKIAIRVGETLRQALAPTPSNDGRPIAEGGIDGTPYGQAGIGLFVGVGFDIGIASASIGIQGTLNLGRISLPVHAGAGIVVSAVGDDRAVTMELPPYLQDLVDGGYLLPEATFPVRKFAFDLGFRYGASLTLSKILSGSVDLRVRVRFFFFSKTWRKNLVSFNGLPTKEYVLFSGGTALTSADWGTVEMPMPFFQLTHIRSRLPVTDTAPVWNDYPHEQFLYDSQCSCIPNIESVPVDEQDDLRECARIEDCCDQGADRTCFKDPATPGSKGVCSGKREVGTFEIPPIFGNPGVPAHLGWSCNDDDDCADGGNCLARDVANDLNADNAPALSDVCMPAPDCFEPCSEPLDCPNSTGAAGDCDSNNRCAWYLCPIP